MTAVKPYPMRPWQAPEGRAQYKPLSTGRHSCAAQGAFSGFLLPPAPKRRPRVYLPPRRGEYGFHPLSARPATTLTARIGFKLLSKARGEKRKPRKDRGHNMALPFGDSLSHRPLVESGGGGGVGRDMGWEQRNGGGW